MLFEFKDVPDQRVPMPGGPGRVELQIASWAFVFCLVAVIAITLALVI